MGAVHDGLRWGAIAALAWLAACSNGRGSLEESPPPPAPPAVESFTLGGTVTGLAGTGLVLQNNGGDDLAISTNGSFTFATRLANASAYSVTVLTQPSGPTQSCSVENASGTIAGANVSNVTVNCVTGAFALGGTVSGLAGSGLVLQNNGGDDLPITANGSFTFATPVTAGAQYNVTVRTQPTSPSQSCTVRNASGLMGSSDVNDIEVTCVTGTFTVGGTVSGLAGSGLVLQNNGGDDLAIDSNGPFTFAGMLASGATYNVTVRTQPSSPTQSCSVENPAGTVGNANVSNVRIVCATDRFTVGGNVSGLSGSGLVLQINGGDDRAINMNGPYAFATALRSGTAYFVSIRTQPSNPTQTCSISNQTGVVIDRNVTNVNVSCTTAAFTIGGTVNDLSGSGLVLQKNGGDDLPIASNGRFTFASAQASGTSYRVTVRTQPSSPTQACTVQNGEGTVGSSDVRNVRVNCSTSTFSVGGTASGVLGSGLVLQNNGSDPIEVASSGAFVFPRELASGAGYNVTVRTQPSNPTQACTVQSGTGTIGGADVTSVRVTCSTSNFTIGGSVSGLAGTGLVLRNNGADDLAIGSNGAFTFATAQPSGSGYTVTIAAQPANPAQVCTLANANGTVGGANVTNVAVTCTTTQFTVGGTVTGLNGSGLQLENNGDDETPIAANGPFTFGASLPSGSPYSVTVSDQPSDPDQLCAVENGAGTIGDANVQNVLVTCVDEPGGDD